MRMQSHSRFQLADRRWIFLVKDGEAFGQFARFALSTGLSAVISFVLPICLVETTRLGPSVAVPVSLATAYLVNLLVIRNFVYRSTRPWRRDLPVYVGVNGGFRLLEYGAFELLMQFMTAHYAIILFCVLSTSSLLKFFVYRVAFKSRIG